MNFQLPQAAATTTTGFSFGLNTSTTATAAPKFNFGPTQPAAKPGLGGSFLGQAAPTAAAAATTTTSLPVFGAAAPATAPTAAVAATLAATIPAITTAGTATVPSLLNVPKTTAATQPLSLGLGQIGAPSTTAATTGGFANLSTATKTTDSSAVANASQMSYNQLEEHINKWTLELEEQEKIFTDQATQINAWDKILITNNQKILELNDAVQKVKSDQQTLENELEFINTQHKELEESIMPLYKEFMSIPQVDVERSQTYLLVENLDTQLKQMSEDLKEIIDNLNESNKGQDNTDPIIQIGKILNAHMSSLQWIESSSSNIANKLDDLNKMHETFKRDTERSFRSAYYN